MRELRLSDQEVQKLIAPALRRRLKQAGFVSGTASGHHYGFVFPINLGLAGSVSIERFDDGTWVFQQEVDMRLAERTHETFTIHAEAIARASVQFKGG